MKKNEKIIKTRHNWFKCVAEKNILSFYYQPRYRWGDGCIHEYDYDHNLINKAVTFCKDWKMFEQVRFEKLVSLFMDVFGHYEEPIKQVGFHAIQLFADGRGNKIIDIVEQYQDFKSFNFFKSKIKYKMTKQIDSFLKDSIICFKEEVDKGFLFDVIFFTGENDILFCTPVVLFNIFLNCNPI